MNQKTTQTFLIWFKNIIIINKGPLEIFESRLEVDQSGTLNIEEDITPIHTMVRVSARF